MNKSDHREKILSRPLTNSEEGMCGVLFKVEDVKRVPRNTCEDQIGTNVFYAIKQTCDKEGD